MKKHPASSTVQFRLTPRLWLCLLVCAGAMLLGFNLPWQRLRAVAAPTPPPSTTAKLAAGANPAQRGSQADRGLAMLIRRLTDRSTEGLVETNLPEGGYTIDLKGRFQPVSLAKVTPSGAVVTGCVETLSEANAFFGHDLETGEPVEGKTTDDPAEVTGLTPQEYRFYQDLIEEAERHRLLAPALATITIINNDGAGEGFNDPTPKAAEGGNNGATLGAQRMNLFNRAAAIWGAFLDSSVSTSVRSNFDPLTPCSTSGGVLGRAGTINISRDFPNVPFPGTWYHAALANKLSGNDQVPANPEISATFNSSVDTGCLGAGRRFYYGFDNAGPAGTVNLLVVLLHELGHGFGFSSFVNGGTGALQGGFPDVYTRFMFDRSLGLFWNQMTDVQRQTSALNTNNVLWDGPNVRIASGFLTAGRDAATGRVQLFTPNPLQNGSSISHWSTACSPNLLMEPAINAGLPLDLDLTRQQMRDIGWYRDSTADLVPDTITNVAPSGGSVAAGSTVNITWTNNGGFNRNVTIELSTDGGATFPTALATNIANTGAFVWAVPGAPATQARVRVREHQFIAPLGSSAANFAITGGCPTITVNPSTLPAGTRGTAYSRTFTQTGGTGAITWSRSAGTLPSGLTLSAAGVLSGTPTATGSFSFTIKATDANGCMGTRAYTLIINCPTITVNPATLPAGARGTAYSQTFTQTGGTGAITWSRSAGTFPAGLTLSAAGVLSGTPTQGGSFNFTIRAADATGCAGTRAYTLVINCPTITVNPTTLPAGTRGTAYSRTFTQTGTTGAITWSRSAGTLPPGLTLSASGVLSGTPTQAGSFSFTVRAADSGGCSGTRAYTLTINCPTITVNPATLPAGTRGTAYSRTFTQTGGVGAIAWSRSAGTLPTGLTLSAAGVLSGTPTVAGSFNFTIRATDAQGCTGTHAYTVIIN